RGERNRKREEAPDPVLVEEQRRERDEPVHRRDDGEERHAIELPAAYRDDHEYRRAHEEHRSERSVPGEVRRRLREVPAAVEVGEVSPAERVPELEVDVDEP